MTTLRRSGKVQILSALGIFAPALSLIAATKAMLAAQTNDGLQAVHPHVSLADGSVASGALAAFLVGVWNYLSADGQAIVTLLMWSAPVVSAALLAGRVWGLTLSLSHAVLTVVYNVA